MTVWVRLNELPIEYYDAIVLRQIVQALGTVLRVNIHTALEDKGRYARIYIQVDMSKPLVTTVRIGQRCQLIIYEGVNQLCFTCGHLGHRREIFQFTVKPYSPAGPQDATVSNKDDRVNQAPTSPEAHTKVSLDIRDTSEEESSGDAFGP